MDGFGLDALLDAGLKGVGQDQVHHRLKRIFEEELQLDMVLERGSFELDQHAQALVWVGLIVDLRLKQPNSAHGEPLPPRCPWPVEQLNQFTFGAHEA